MTEIELHVMKHNDNGQKTVTSSRETHDTSSKDGKVGRHPTVEDEATTIINNDAAE